MNSSVCPRLHKEHQKQCSCWYDRCFGKCFTKCDLTSNKRCGECKWWSGDITIDRDRHHLFGSCQHYIGGVRADLTTDCDYWTEADIDMPTFNDAVEAIVLIFVGDIYPKVAGEPFVRPLRAGIRKTLLQNF